jgi:hypothetical protein
MDIFGLICFLPLLIIFQYSFGLVDLRLCIFYKGLIPEQWLYGDIIPIFKNKGDKSDPKNYRPITIVSCFG